MRATHEKFLELGLESPFSDDAFQRMLEDAPGPFSTSIDVDRLRHMRAEALRAHATQVDPSITYVVRAAARGAKALPTTEEYQLAKSRVGPVEVTEDDLFAGVDV